MFISPQSNFLSCSILAILPHPRLVYKGYKGISCGLLSPTTHPSQSTRMLVVGVAGGTGDVGRTIVEELLRSAKFKIVVLTRVSTIVIPRLSPNLP